MQLACIFLSVPLGFLVMRILAFLWLALVPAAVSIGSADDGRFLFSVPGERSQPLNQQSVQLGTALPCHDQPQAYCPNEPVYTEFYTAGGVMPSHIIRDGDGSSLMTTTAYQVTPGPTGEKVVTLQYYGPTWPIFNEIQYRVRDGQAYVNYSIIGGGNLMLPMLLVLLIIPAWIYVTRLSFRLLRQMVCFRKRFCLFCSRIVRPGKTQSERTLRYLALAPLFSAGLEFSIGYLRYHSVFYAGLLQQSWSYAYVPCCLYCSCLWLDRRALARSRRPLPPFVAADLVPPLYLIRRAQMVATAPRYLAVWLTGFVLTHVVLTVYARVA